MSVDKGTILGVQAAVGVGAKTSLDDVLRGKTDVKDHMFWSRIITRKGSYQAPAAPLTYGVMPMEDGPQENRLWELLHFSVVGTITANSTPDPFTAVAIPAIACILDEVPADSATEPASFNDIVGKLASLDGTPQYPPSRRGALLRYPQRLVFIFKGLAANTVVAASAQFIDHDYITYLQKLNG